jgi:hypothetical protein
MCHLPWSVAVRAERSTTRWRRTATRLALLAGLAALACTGNLRAEEDPFSAEDRGYWALQPLGHYAPPAVQNRDWVRNPIDAFILQKLEAAGIAPAAEADRRVLIRRLVFDLHGLPPTPEQMEEFLADRSPDAYERLVDRLLASPRQGEKWARHWLDLVRYGDSDGYNQDAARPNAWQYRDYVIRSLNADKPFDHFLAEQLAGDELAPHDPEALLATGFLRLWPYEYNQRNVPLQREVIANDLTDVAGQVFLGFTIQCARCHDHKYDPILQRDYFRLQAFFAPVVPRDDVVLASPQEAARHAEQLRQWEEQTLAARDALAQFEAPYRQKALKEKKALFPKEIQAIAEMPPEQRSPLQKQYGWLVERQLVIVDQDLEKLIKGEQRKKWDALRETVRELEKTQPALPTIMAAADVGPVAPPTIIPGEGSLEDPSTHIAPGGLSIISDRPIEGQASSTSTGRRTALVRWLTGDARHIVARVFVNRLWHHHFRRGLVATPSDFGRQGEACTHPELLDWLAARFIDSGWSLKQMHHLMVTSAAYRQSSLPAAAGPAAAADPDNKLLWRMRGGRLEAEALRDAWLAASGDLNPAMGGAGVFDALPESMSQRHGWTATANEHERTRRSVYLFVKRNLPHPLLEALDAPDAFQSCSRRLVTTTPTQSLMLLNGEWALHRAQSLAGRALQAGSSSSESAMVDRIYLLCYGRSAQPEEIKRAMAFLDQQARKIAERLRASQPVALPAATGESTPLDPARAAALVDFCHVVLNSNEMVYVD